MKTNIEEKIKKIDKYFRTSGKVTSEKEHTYARIIKLNEEVGELCEAALYEQDPHQRVKNKDIDFDTELADVLICSLLIAECRNKDIWETVNQKLEKQLKRFNI